MASRIPPARRRSVCAGRCAVGAALGVFRAPAWLAAILPSVEPGQLISLPAHLAPAMPYVLVLIALAVFATRADMPAALGKADV